MVKCPRISERRNTMHQYYIWKTCIKDMWGTIMIYFSGKEPKIGSDNIGRIITWNSTVYESAEEPTEKTVFKTHREGSTKYVRATDNIDIELLEIKSDRK
jgi:RIO-like serine/threonine protein kinase